MSAVNLTHETNATILCNELLSLSDGELKQLAGDEFAHSVNSLGFKSEPCTGSHGSKSQFYNYDFSVRDISFHVVLDRELATFAAPLAFWFSSDSHLFSWKFPSFTISRVMTNLGANNLNILRDDSMYQVLVKLCISKNRSVFISAYEGGYHIGANYSGVLLTP